MVKINSRTKGRLGEREIIDLLQPIVNEVYLTVEIPAPKLQRNSLQSDGGGFDIVGLDWIAIECKRCETLGVSNWWAQCVRQAGNDREPVLCYRQNGKAWRVQLYATMYSNCGYANVSHLLPAKTRPTIGGSTMSVNDECTLNVIWRDRDQSLFYDYIEDVVCAHDFFENGRLTFGVFCSTECDSENEKLRMALKMWRKAQKNPTPAIDVGLTFRFNLLEEIKRMVGNYKIFAKPGSPIQIEESSMLQFNVLRTELTQALALLDSIQVIQDRT
jgi:hypothetical protein